MGFDVLKKDENYHTPRPTGIDQPPIIRHVVGSGSQFDQSWKTGNGANWSEETRKPAKTNALNEAFFKRSKG
jgi:hypothetical protein